MCASRVTVRGHAFIQWHPSGQNQGQNSFPSSGHEHVSCIDRIISSLEWTAKVNLSKHTIGAKSQTPSRSPRCFQAKLTVAGMGLQYIYERLPSVYLRVD